jgi:hypothetical protein
MKQSLGSIVIVALVSMHTVHAHRPTSAELIFHSQHNTFDIVINHNINQRTIKYRNTNPREHYIKKIELFLKGMYGLNRPKIENRIFTKVFNQQYTPQIQFGHYGMDELHPNAQLRDGDIVILKAYCSLAGVLEQEILIQRTQPPQHQAYPQSTQQPKGATWEGAIYIENFAYNPAPSPRSPNTQPQETNQNLVLSEILQCLHELQKEVYKNKQSSSEPSVPYQHPNSTSGSPLIPHNAPTNNAQPAPSSPKPPAETLTKEITQQPLAPITISTPSPQPVQQIPVETIEQLPKPASEKQTTLSTKEPPLTELSLKDQVLLKIKKLLATLFSTKPQLVMSYLKKHYMPELPQRTFMHSSFRRKSKDLALDLFITKPQHLAQHLGLASNTLHRHATNTLNHIQHTLYKSNKHLRTQTTQMINNQQKQLQHVTQAAVQTSHRAAWTLGECAQASHKSLVNVANTLATAQQKLENKSFKIETQAATLVRSHQQHLTKAAHPVAQIAHDLLITGKENIVHMAYQIKDFAISWCITKPYHVAQTLGNHIHRVSTTAMHAVTYTYAKTKQQAITLSNSITAYTQNFIQKSHHQLSLTSNMVANAVHQAKNHTYETIHNVQKLAQQLHYTAQTISHTWYKSTVEHLAQTSTHIKNQAIDQAQAFHTAVTNSFSKASAHAQKLTKQLNHQLEQTTLATSKVAKELINNVGSHLKIGTLMLSSSITHLKEKAQSYTHNLMSHLKDNPHG